MVAVTLLHRDRDHPGVRRRTRVAGLAGGAWRVDGRGGRVAMSHGRLGSTLVVAQVALSLLLVIGAGLFVRTLHNLRTLDRGFGVDDVLLVGTDATRSGYSGAKLSAFNDEVLAFIEGLPGVRAASVAAITPLAGGGISQVIEVNGVRTGPDEMHVNTVGPRYFEAMQTPIVAGRDFAREDSATSGRSSRSSTKRSRGNTWPA